MPTPKQIERTAWQLLQEHDLAETPVDLEELAECLGIDISCESMEDEVSGMLLIEDGDTHVIVNGGHHSNRRRFSAAHEIGHFELHASDENKLFVDRSFFRNQKSSIGVSRQEVEANAFAAALLMPSPLIEKALPDDDSADIDVYEMAREFGVSEHAMTIRLINLGHLAP
ncbi:MAG: ImmA/IrrE family metallo-endopeptidase [Pseudomonadota bacterium]